MCVVCKDWEKGKLTSKEALNALGELIDSSTDYGDHHYFDAVNKILDKEVPSGEPDSELDKSWHEETHE